MIASNPLAPFQTYQNHVSPMKIDRKNSVTASVTTLTGGTKDNRIHAILLEVYSPKAFRLVKPILEKRDSLPTASKIVVTRDNLKFGGRTRVQFFAGDGSEIFGDFLWVGPKGAVNA